MRDLERDQGAARILDAVLARELDQELGELARDVAEDQGLDLVLELAAANDHEAGHREAELRVAVDELLEVNAIDLGEQGVLDRLGHLGARAAVEQAAVAEQLGRAVVGEREGLAVARDLADLDAPAVDEEQRATRITWEIDDVASPCLAQLHALCHTCDRVRTEIGEQRDLAEVPENALGIGHVEIVATLSSLRAKVARITALQGIVRSAAPASEAA